MLTKEKLNHHINHLQEKHAVLDRQIDLMESNGHFEDADITHLKKKRLAINDEINLVKSQIVNLT